MTPVLTKATLEPLQSALQEAKDLLVTQNATIERLASPPLDYGTVVEQHKARKGKAAKKSSVVEMPAMLTVLLNGTPVKVLAPEFPVAPGDVVSVNTFKQVVAVETLQPSGDISYVKRIVDKHLVEVDGLAAVRVVYAGQYSGKVQEGDRVVLNFSGQVILKNLGRDSDQVGVYETPNVAWNDIGGLEEAKAQMREIVELPHTKPELFKYYNKKPIKGVLLYGPPGCGKTMLGKAAAKALAGLYKGKSGGFFYIKGPEILDRFVGVAEAAVRSLFAQARLHKANHGYPAVVFIDEADSLLGKRGSGISSDIERTIVPMFLAEMDGFEDSGALVILATNRPDTLDPAIVRDGRVDRKIRITRPTPDGARQILRAQLKDIPLHNGHTRDHLAARTTEEIFSSRRVLYNIQTSDGAQHQFTLGHLINGAMAVGIVDQATSRALQRDLKTNNRNKRGLRESDLVAAVDSVYQQNRDLNHTDDLSEFVRNFKDDVLGVHKLSVGTV